MFAFTVIWSYLEHGAYPLTPEIEGLLSASVAFLANDSDKAAGWLVETICAARMSDVIARIEATFPSLPPKAQIAIFDCRSQAG